MSSNRRRAIAVPRVRAGPPRRRRQLFQLELTSKNRGSLMFQRASIRFLHRWPPEAVGGDNLFSDSYLPYRWHHIVSQGAQGAGRPDREP